MDLAEELDYLYCALVAEEYEDIEYSQEMILPKFEPMRKGE